MARFLLGVNYWPRTGPDSLWSTFDIGAIDEDLARIAALGFDAVRFFVSWSAFAPDPERLSQEALDRFEILLDRIDAHGLRAMPTLFCARSCCDGAVPAWAEDPSGDGSAGDFYSGELFDAQRAYARALGERARDHAALLVWDIGSGFTQLRRPRSPREAAHWSAALATDLFAGSNVPATGGLSLDDLTEDRQVRPSSVADPWKFASMQGSSVASSFARGKLDSHVEAFACEAIASFAHKPVLYTAVGNPTAAGDAKDGRPKDALSEEEMAVYARKVLDRLQHRGALGAFWWCWSDYAGAGPENTFGIVRVDGTEKPVARVLSGFSAERRPLAELPPPILNEEEYYAGLPRSLARAYASYVEERGVSEEIS
jgi:endo-1,4-beta-mannosidase